MKIDADAAEAWALEASPAAGSDPAVRVLIRRYFDRDPERAMEWSQRSLRTGPTSLFQFAISVNS